MGIKFHCPNGHKLNVKSFLSGKKAICPKCGVKVLVPTVSNPTASTTESEGPNDADDVAGTEQNISEQLGDATTSASAPISTQATGQFAHTSAHVPVESGPGFPSAVAAAGGPARDAIDEAPTAVWYVRPPSGGQFGPAAADMMRSWLSDGRVTANSLVWRSGWPQWQSAQSAFPQLAVASPSAGPAFAPGAASQGAAGYGQSPIGTPIIGTPFPAATSIPMGQVVVGQPIGQSPLGQIATGAPLGGGFAAGEEAITRRRRRRKSSDTTVIVSAILIVLTLVLVVILVIVLTRETNHSTAEPTPAKTNLPVKKAPPAPAEKKTSDEEI